MSLLESIVAKRMGVEEPRANPIMASLLKQFGVSPDEIRDYAEHVKEAIVEKLTSIDVELKTISNRLTEIESNMIVLMKDAREDEQLAIMIASATTVESRDL
jgi:hypothetical protein